MTRRRATQPVTIPRLRARGDAASCPVTSLCLSRRHEMDPWRSAPSNRAIPGPFSELSFKVSSSRQFTIHGSKKQDGGRRTSLPLDPRQTSPSARPATVIAPDIGMLQSTAHSIPGAPGWCSSSFAGTLRGMGLRRDALRRPLYILHPEVTTPWHLYRLGACRSAEALPCRGGNAGHLEMAVPSLPDIVSKPPAENSRGPRKRPHPHILGIPTDINIGSTGGHSAARPRGALSRAGVLGE